MSTSRRTRSGAISCSSSKKRIGSNKVVIGEEDFLKMIDLAEYEITIDPYRGIQLLIAQHRNHENQIHSSINTNGDSGRFEENKGWWRSACSLRYVRQSTHESAVLQDTQTSTDSSDIREVLSVVDSDEERLLTITGCNCPTLLKWMSSARLRDEKRASKKKRKRTSNSNTSSSGCFGRQQSEDASLECPCDYNPFCIGTLGGAMDDILEEWARERSTPKESQSDFEFEDAVIVIDDASTTMETMTDNFDYSVPNRFKPTTLEQLKKVRKYADVDETSVRLYLGKILQGLTEWLSIDEGVDQIRKFHQLLVFTNPVVSHKHAINDSTESPLLRLSMPPGIENLGATCYLNTQLQCLAQNLIFLDGIISWRPSTKNEGDRMTSVLALFQDLLLRMICGQHSTVNTLEFSDALGLDHFEQQDPNEFSRLFFDRMHDSFQGSEDNKNLTDLLPRLFQGVTAYETTCLVCGTKSKRTEEFMDLNLPIVPRYSSNSGNQRKVDSLQSRFDTEVQHCLNEYCSDEMLHGENQYHCSNCNGKCNAKRAVSFQTLPPVLNIQLCRYVFDREKYMKTKLSDRVLLPLHLDVDSLNESQATCCGIKNKYILCAIMRHKGTSAYSGHYVAEAMDWRSGQWFEFNDASVIHLKNGPSCSYDPSSIAVDEVGTINVFGINGLIGSTDAYNMYYVEESFLARCTLEKLRDNKEPSNESSLVSKERSRYYEELRQMCLGDERVAKHLHSRRQQLCASMLPKLTNLDATNSSNMVWVETTFLRQFLSCKELLTEQPGNRSILSHHKLLCSHKTPALHPRIARRGKLLPKDAYDAYIKIIQEELNAIFGTNFSSQNVNDWPIFPKDNLVCEDCIFEYRTQLAAKVSSANALIFLFNELDRKELNFSRNLQPGETIVDASDEYAFMVSRKFITWFRNKTIRFMKRASNAKNEPKRQADVSIPEFSFAVGLDGFSFDEFLDSESSTLCSGIVDDEGIAVRVNGPLTCRHGNFIAKTSGNSFVFVPCNVWKTIKQLFPAAVEHKRKRITSTEELENSSEDDDDMFGCMQCNGDEVSRGHTRRSVVDFAKHCQKLQSKVVVSRDEVSAMALSADNVSFYLVPMDDFDVWNKVLSILSRKEVGKGDLSFKHLAETALLNRLPEHTRHRMLEDADNMKLSVDDLQRLELLCLFFRSNVCDTHGLQVCDALFRNGKHQLRTQPFELIDNFFVVPESDYQQYVSHVSVAVIMMCLAESDFVWKESTMDDCIAEGVHFLDRFKSSFVVHPLCVSGHGESQKSVGDRFAYGNAEFQLQKRSCSNECCRLEYRKKQAPNSNGKRDVPEFTLCRGVANDPIDIEKELKPVLSVPATVSVIVLDVKANADLSAILTMLASADGIPNNDEQDCDQFFMRRSSRRRTSRYSVGDVFDEEAINMNFDNNIAALRLLLLERCTKGTEFELNHDLKIVFMTKFKTDDKATVSGDSNEISMTISNTEPFFKLIDLPFSVNDITIRDLCEECLGCPHDESITTFLIRQAIVEPSTEKIAKDQLMDTLLSLSNAAIDEKAVGNVKSKKSRTEKGFSGTFLSLAPVTKAAMTATEANCCSAATSTDILANLESDNNVCTDPQIEPFFNTDDGVLVSHDIALKQDVVDSHSTSDEHRALAVVDSKLSVSSNHTLSTKQGFAKENIFSETSKVYATELNGRTVNHTNERTTSDIQQETSICNKDDDSDDINGICSDIQHEKSICIQNDDIDDINGISSAIQQEKAICIQDDDSDDDIKLLQCPFKPNSISPSKKQSNRQIQLSLCSLGVQNAPMNNNPTNERRTVDQTKFQSRLRSGVRDSQLITEIVQILLSIPEIPHKEDNKKMCHMAAESAMQMHPNVNEALDLVEPAYAVYLELMLP